MVQVNVREAKDNFSRLLAMVEAGEEVVIARNGVPVAHAGAGGTGSSHAAAGSFMAHFRASAEKTPSVI